jgi:hypothetical protein
MILFHLNKSGKFNSPTLLLFLVSCIVMRNNSFDSKKSDNNEDAGRSLTVRPKKSKELAPSIGYYTLSSIVLYISK